MNRLIIKIVDKDINNVPCSRIFDDNNINKDIQQHCKDILLISKNRQDGHPNDEVGRLVSIFNINDRIDILGTWDEQLKTCIIRTNTFEYEEMVISHRKNELVFIHNHPNNSSISFSDLMMLLLDDSIRCVIAIGNTRNTYFLMKNDKSKYSYNKLYTHIINDVMSIENNKLRIERENIICNNILKNSQKYFLTYGISERST